MLGGGLWHLPELSPSFVKLKGSSKSEYNEGKSHVQEWFVKFAKKPLKYLYLLSIESIIHPSISLSLYPFIFPSIHPSIHSYTYPVSYLPTYLSTFYYPFSIFYVIYHLSIYLSPIYSLSFIYYLSMYQPSVYLSSLYPSIYPFICYLV